MANDIQCVCEAVITYPCGKSNDDFDDVLSKRGPKSH